MVLVQGTTRKNTKEFHGGNPTGSAVKKNGREGIRGSGSSIRAVLKLDSLTTVGELSTQNAKQITGECHVSYCPHMGLSVENCKVSVRHNTTHVHDT